MLQLSMINKLSNAGYKMINHHQWKWVVTRLKQPNKTNVKISNATWNHNLIHLRNVQDTQNVSSTLLPGTYNWPTCCQWLINYNSLIKWARWLAVSATYSQQNTLPLAQNIKSSWTAHSCPEKSWRPQCQGHRRTGSSAALLPPAAPSQSRTALPFKFTNWNFRFKKCFQCYFANT